MHIRIPATSSPTRSGGRVTEINLERRTIAIDAIDRKTKKLRNYFFVLDPKVKVTREKKKVAITELTPGQAVVCVAEIELNERGEQTRVHRVRHPVRCAGQTRGVLMPAGGDDSYGKGVRAQ